MSDAVVPFLYHKPPTPSLFAISVHLKSDLSDNRHIFVLP